MPSKADLREEIRSLKRKLRKHRKSALKRKLNSARADVADMSDTIDEWMTEFAELRNENRGLREKNELVHADRNNAVRENERLRREITESEKDLAATADKLRQVTTVALEHTRFGPSESEGEKRLRKENADLSTRNNSLRSAMYRIAGALGSTLLASRIMNRDLIMAPLDADLEQLVAAASRLRNFKMMLERLIARAQSDLDEMAWDAVTRGSSKDQLETLKRIHAVYVGMEARLPEPAPVTGTYLDNGFLLEDVQVLLDISSTFILRNQNEPSSRWEQVMMILQGIANHGELKAEFTRCVNDLVGELRRQRAVEIPAPPPPPKAN